MRPNNLKYKVLIIKNHIGSFGTWYDNGIAIVISKTSGKYYMESHGKLTEVNLYNEQPMIFSGEGTKLYLIDTEGNLQYWQDDITHVSTYSKDKNVLTKSKTKSVVTPTKKSSSETNQHLELLRLKVRKELELEESFRKEAELEAKIKEINEKVRDARKKSDEMIRRLRQRINN
jgi:hypothetical protein